MTGDVALVCARPGCPYQIDETSVTVTTRSLDYPDDYDADEDGPPTPVVETLIYHSHLCHLRHAFAQISDYLFMQGPQGPMGVMGPPGRSFDDGGAP